MFDTNDSKAGYVWLYSTSNGSISCIFILPCV